MVITAWFRVTTLKTQRCAGCHHIANDSCSAWCTRRESQLAAPPGRRAPVGPQGRLVQIYQPQTWGIHGWLVVSTYPSEKYELLVSCDDDISNIYIYMEKYIKKTNHQPDGNVVSWLVCGPSPSLNKYTLVKLGAKTRFPRKKNMIPHLSNQMVTIEI